jgi:predicted NACHT family NTPase
VRPFVSVQIELFIQNWYLANEIMSAQRDDPGIHADAKLGADDLIKRIYSTPTLSDLAVNPLLLTMIATVHRYRSSLPGRRVELYSEICEVFLGKRQEARGLALDLTPAQKQRVLQPLAYSMMKSQQRVIKQGDIQLVITNPLSSVNPNIDWLAFIKDVENTSGLFIEQESSEYGFSHLTFQEYLTATHVFENRLESELISHITDTWWHETIRLYCAQTDASTIIEACLSDKSVLALGLAIECMEEAREVNTQVRGHYDEIIKQGLRSRDPERRRLIGEVMLNTRTKKR